MCLQPYSLTVKSYVRPLMEIQPRAVLSIIDSVFQKSAASADGRRAEKSCSKAVEKTDSQRMRGNGDPAGVISLRSNGFLRRRTFVFSDGSGPRNATFSLMFQTFLSGFFRLEDSNCWRKIVISGISSVIA